MYNDTIAAIATPPGEGGIGIVRLSGALSPSIAMQIFRFARKVDKPRSHRLYYGHVVNPLDGEPIDEALISFMTAPHTYTKEDVVEINCHGGIMPLAKTLELVLAHGARPAEPGEFTQRAFLNGRIDLAQAEAVIQIIRAKTESAMLLGLSQLTGHLSKKIKSIRQALLSVLAHIEASIDFPEHQDVEELAQSQIREGALFGVEQISLLLATADKGRILREGVRTAIIGRPNVGKSSLLNALLREQRAIVTAIPGTTRDVLEESINLGGVALTIVDTAGIRQTGDEVEKIGVERSLKALEQADLILYVLDLPHLVTEEDREILAAVGNKPCILIANKTDLITDASKAVEQISLEVSPAPVVAMSLAKEQGLDQLEETIISLVFQGDVKPPQSVMVTSARHKEALRRALASLQELQVALAAGYAVDLLAIDLHSTLEALGEITGETVSTDLAQEIFRSFCIGK